MLKVKCCYVACRFNSATLTLGEDGKHYDGDDIGNCNYVGEIELGPCNCESCIAEGEGMDCKQFEPKKLK